MKKKIFIFITILIFYYQLDYKRYFITSRDGKKVITIWQRVNNQCYIIPERYYLPFAPSTNYIITKNYTNYIGVVFNSYDYMDISIYNDFNNNLLNNDINVIYNNDIMLYSYGILEELDLEKGIRVYSKNMGSKKKYFDYVYIDLNRIYGIKVWRW